MTKKFQDLFKSFTAMDNSEQLEEVRHIRHRRSIERPKVAKKRQKREAKKSRTNLEKVKDMLGNMTPEQKIAFLNNLKAKGSLGD